MKHSSLMLLIVVLVTALPCRAQASESPRPTLEMFAGHAGFLDDSMIPHTVLGGSGRFYLTSRLGVGPEFVYMWGPGSDRDLFLTGNLTWDLLRPRVANPRRITPFVVGGGGIFRHSERFGSGSEGSFTAGGGTRVRLSDRVYSVVDFRIGWEAHYRITGGIGVRLSR